MEVRVQVSATSHGAANDSVKLYRYNDDILLRSAHALLERDVLTDEEIRLFCQSSATHVGENANDETNGPAKRRTLSSTELYRKRRQEIHSLLQLLPTEHARIDRTTGRLERVPEHEIGDVHAPLPPLPPLAPAAQHGERQAGNNQQHQPPPLHPPPPRNVVGDEERLLAIAAADIARAVARYRAAGIRDTELRLIRFHPPPHAAPPNEAADRPPHNRQRRNDPAQNRPPVPLRQAQNARLRTILYFTGAMLSSAFWVTIRSVPAWHKHFSPKPERSTTTAIGFDETLAAVAQVRHWALHARHCGGLQLHRNPSPSQENIDMELQHHWWCPSKQRRTNMTFTGCSTASDCLVQLFDTVSSLHHQISGPFCFVVAQPLDCSQGVLHIPSVSTIQMGLAKAKPTRDVSWWARRINVAWWMPCRVPSHHQMFDAADRGNYSETKLLPLTTCFRGVHDGVISRKQINAALEMGADIISYGFDHFDVHYDVKFLHQRLPTVLSTLEVLLRDQYSVAHPMMHSIVPVTFRVNAVGPMDGTDLPSRHSSSWSTNPLLSIFNQTRYFQWMESSARQNRWAQYSRHFHFRWPGAKRSFGTTAARDTCILVSDLQVDPKFTIHTTVFLSDGEDIDFSGGVALYEDYDAKARDSERKRRHKKIQSGISVDGSRGRVVVSTGGLENRRCRLPTRSGVRATLQIWWHLPERVDH